MSSYTAGPNSDLAVLTQLLVEHQLIGREQRCTCGHQYRLGESIREHRALKVLEAGFRRNTEKATR